MRHCQECGQPYPSQRDYCPECWKRTSPGPPRRQERLQLIFESTYLYEAEMIENLLRNEGIPCLKVPGCANALAPFAALTSQSSIRLYVHRATASEARSLVEEVTGETSPRTKH